MSISPAVVATPLTQAPGVQAPPSPLDGGGTQGAAPQADFSSMLNGGAAPLPQAAPAPALPGQGVPGQGAIASHDRLGDQVLNGLRKLGKSVEAMGNMGLPPHGAKAPSAAKPALPNTAPPGGVPTQQGATPTQDLASNFRDMHAMWEGGMQHQKQLYATVFEFELVQESAQSMMKSLKSLLTQGGG